MSPLIVAGKKRDEDRSNFIHCGIATRSFERRFTLADHIQVVSADLKDGLLSVELVLQHLENAPLSERSFRDAAATPEHNYGAYAVGLSSEGDFNPVNLSVIF